MLTHEHTINDALGEVLAEIYRDGANINSERVGNVFVEGGRPDILIVRDDGWVIVLEAEVVNYQQAMQEAQERLGNTLVATGAKVHTVVAIVYPEALRQYQREALRNALRNTNLEYALLTEEADGTETRFPNAGWMSGNVTDLVVLLHRATIPASRVEALAVALENGVSQAAGTFTAAHAHGTEMGQRVAELLGQSDDEGGQTRLMTMTVVADALVFHAALSAAEMEVPDDPPRSVRSPNEFRIDGVFPPTSLSDEWNLILRVNYWPIFHTAGEIIRILPTEVCGSVLDILWRTTERLIVGGVTQSHDLTGIVFQRLIADRKFLATYYTRPAAAALLAGLAIPSQTPIIGDHWGDYDSISTLRIGDFACGTGTLLSTAYQRIGLLHKIHGGDPRRLHPQVMEHGLVGLDVLRVAVHLTAAMLAGSYPDTPFGGECLLTMPYGDCEWGMSLGSLDLLAAQPMFQLFEEAAQVAGGHGDRDVQGLVQQVGHNEFNLVIMNPPFTRHGAREGERAQVHNPAFAAFGADEVDQNQLSRQLKKLAVGSCGHGHAGLASYFVELAHRKTAPYGTLALVLPLSAMSGMSWENVRALWRNEYSSSIFVTIAGEGNYDSSFSADTGMAECLFVGRKEKPQDSVHRAKFVILNRQPRDTLEGEQIAHAISSVVAQGDIRRLEDGPVGGNRIFLGEMCVGEIVDCQTPIEGAWQMCGVRDISLGQTAYQLSNGHLWIEGMPRAGRREIPIASLRDVIRRIGPHHLDLTGSTIKSDGLPQGPFERIHDQPPPGSAYPCLWNHDTTRERRLVVEPDSYCRIPNVIPTLRDVLAARAEERWATAVRSHYNLDLQFNAQSIIVAMTEQPSMGGRAWPTVIFDDPMHEYAFSLWSNSSLGLLCHWWMANKTQAGRGTSTITSIPKFTTIDLRALTDEQHVAAQTAIEAMAGERFLPFDQINEDTARADLDRRLIVDVLGLSPDLCAAGGAMERLRTKLATEPQIHSNKKTRVVFADAEEKSVRR